MRLFISWVKLPIGLQYVLWGLLLSLPMTSVYGMYSYAPQWLIFKLLHYLIYAAIGLALYLWTSAFRQQHPKFKSLPLYLANSFMVILLLGFTYWMKHHG